MDPIEVQKNTTPTQPQQPPTPPASLENASVLKPLQTYERDIAEMIRNHQTSVVQVKMAAEKKDEALPAKEKVEVKAMRAEAAGLPTPARESRTPLFNKFFVVFSFVFILGGGAALAYIYFTGTTSNTPVVVTPSKQTTLIAANASLPFAIDSLTQRQIADGFRTQISGAFTDNSIVHIPFTQKVNGEVVDVSPSTFFEYATLTTPPRLLRAMNTEFFSGIYVMGDVHPVFLVGISDFDNAYDGMLTWEKTAFQDFESFIRTARTAAPATAILPQPAFIDLVIANKDARVLRDTAGNIVMAYSFISNSMLLLADSEEAFKEVVARYTTSQLTR